MDCVKVLVLFQLNCSVVAQICVLVLFDRGVSGNTLTMSTM